MRGNMLSLQVGYIKREGDKRDIAIRKGGLMLMGMMLMVRGQGLVVTRRE